MLDLERGECAELRCAQKAQPAARGEGPPILLTFDRVLEDLGDRGMVRAVAGDAPVADALGKTLVQLGHDRFPWLRGGENLALQNPRGSFNDVPT